MFGAKTFPPAQLERRMNMFPFVSNEDPLLRKQIAQAELVPIQQQVVAVQTEVGCCLLAVYLQIQSLPRRKKGKSTSCEWWTLYRFVSLFYNAG